MVKADKLIIGNLTVEPYFYEEGTQNDALFIIARARLTAEQAEPLRQMIIRYSMARPNEQYFPVVREGLSDEPRQMRFGGGAWSQRDGIVNQEITLVDRVYDEHGGGVNLLTAQKARTDDNIVELSARLEELLSLLRAKHILTDDELERVRQPTPEMRARQRFELLRVNDLDMWPT
jgi:hypothetical protein